MSFLTVTNTFNAGQVIEADDFNTNYSDIVTYINNRNSGVSSWECFWITRSGGVPLTANNSTGTQDIARFQDNGTNTFQALNGGIINTPLQAYCRMTTSPANTELPSSTVTVLNLLTIQSQTQSMGYVYPSNYILIPATGKYLISATIYLLRYALTTNVTYRGYIYKNQTTAIDTHYFHLQGSVASGVSRAFTLSDVHNLSASDKIDVRAYAPTGSYYGYAILNVTKLS